MSASQAELKEIIARDSDDATVEVRYRGSGNYDVYVEGVYLGTAWYS